ncbi:hypothetical protein FOC1_g10007081 [Fusarium oxysporum f. sp. cubense race 1]|uniref:Secreted protein n=1 Tax=Fusarium oxysporum f. sp. cubense (strain race 1) TaxID=1229664 RepID=N4UES6_FUSC1|nr:hypothetical protein FOC1_g10007081 [Fusarium oxysporum f. sp. cubense race 1]
MKASVIYGLATLFGASHVIAGCVEGHRETIAPDYIVEHKCNMYRTGTTHEKIASAKDCAALCQAAGVEPLLSAPEDRFGRLQGRMHCCRRRPGTCLLYYKHIRELQPAGNFKVEGAWRSWDKEC